LPAAHASRDTLDQRVARWIITWQLNRVARSFDVLGRLSGRACQLELLTHSSTAMTYTAKRRAFFDWLKAPHSKFGFGQTSPFRRVPVSQCFRT
jgi:hypothetical protein